MLKPSTELFLTVHSLTNESPRAVRPLPLLPFDTHPVTTQPSPSEIPGPAVVPMAWQSLMMQLSLPEIPNEVFASTSQFCTTPFTSTVIPLPPLLKTFRFSARTFELPRPLMPWLPQLRMV